MRNNNQSVGLSLLVSALVLTGVPSAQAAPNTFNTALPVPQGETIWREQLVLRERSDDGPMDREVSVQALGSVLGYGITPKLAVFGVVPYFFNKELDVTTPMGRIERDTGGIGDVSLFGRYRSLKSNGTKTYGKDALIAVEEWPPRLSMYSVSITLGDNVQRSCPG